jgi:hypothetical protein
VDPRQLTLRLFDPLRARLPFAGMAALILLARISLPMRELTESGWAAVRDLGLTLALWFLASGLFLGLGSRLLRRLGPPQLTSIEPTVLAFGLGCGGVAYLILALGLIGWLTPASLMVLIIGLSYWLAPELNAILKSAPGIPGRLRSWWRRSPAEARAIAILAVVIASLSFATALTPPWDYDGLMYHLVGPKLFLDANRIFAYPDNWHINGPFTIEMLFTLGMAFGDDVFPKLVHLSFGILLTLATFAAGQRWLSERKAWIAVAVLLTVPTLPIWASFAYVDLGWAVFEFLAAFSAIQWWRESDRRWLGLSGAFIGLALGSKYLALIGLALLSAFIVLITWRRSQRLLSQDLLRFVGPAVVVAAPWYVKNALWLGNPVFPFIFGGPDWDPSRLGLYMSYLNSFGVGRSALDYLLLPWNIYARHESFGAVMNRIDIPSILFPLAALYPWKGSSRSVGALLALAAVWCLAWSLGSQQIRFLLPVYPALAIGTAEVIGGLSRPGAGRIPWHTFLPNLSIGLMLLTLFYQVRVLGEYDLLDVVIGSESRQQFLSRAALDLPALQAADLLIEGTGRVLMLGDGRGYYCLPGCIPDPDHFRRAAEIARLPVERLAQWFADQRADYLLLSWEDIDFLLQHDVDGNMAEAIRAVGHFKEAGCLRSRYSDEWAELFEVVCRP